MSNNKDHLVGQLTTYPPSTVLACQRDGITWPECRRHEGQRLEVGNPWVKGLDLEYVFLLISFHSIKIIIMRKRARSREGRRQFLEYSDEKGQKSVAGAPRRPPASDKRRLAGGKRKQQLEKVFQQNPPSVAPTSLSSHSVFCHDCDILPFRYMMFKPHKQYVFWTPMTITIHWLHDPQCPGYDPLFAKNQFPPADKHAGDATTPKKD